MSVYALVEAVVIPMNAFLLGRFSTRSLFVGSFVMFAIGSGIIAAGPTFAWLIVGRILQAFATGVAITMATTLVLITVPRASRGRMMGLLGLVISFAPAIGAPASGGLVDIVGWRVLLVGVAVLGFALAAIGAAFGTTSIVSLTALAPGIDGYRLGFIGCAALLAVVAAMVLVSIRDR